MKISRQLLRPFSLAAALATLSLNVHAGTITFAEYDGMANDSVIPIDSLPTGLPDGVTATWTGFLLHTTAGDTPMSVFPSGAQAILAFSPAAIVPSFNAYD